MSAPRIVIVDDHQLFRSGVRAELEGLVEIVGDADGVDAAERLILDSSPDVVLLDVHMPDGGGVEVIRRVAPERPNTRFLALSVSDDAEDVIAVIRAGARGYVTKTISGDELADAIRRVHGGDAVFSPRLAGFVLDAFAGAAPAPAQRAAAGPQPAPQPGARSGLRRAHDPRRPRAARPPPLRAPRERPHHARDEVPPPARRHALARPRPARRPGSADAPRRPDPRRAAPAHGAIGRAHD